MKDPGAMPVNVSAIFQPRKRSLTRANLLVLVSLIAAIALSNFPNNRATPFLAVPAFFSVIGTADTVRCIRKSWSFYHAGVILCIYMDLMAVAIILFFLLYPYWMFLSSSH